VTQDQMDTWLAQNVMGWRQVGAFWVTEQGQGKYPLGWSPTRRPGPMWEVAREMSLKGNVNWQGPTWDSFGQTWYVRWKHKDHNYCETGATENEAVCKAAYQITQGRKLNG
jgi:hypothetical protein